MKTTAGVVANKTTSEAELYSGGATNGINEAYNYAAYLQLNQNLFERLNISAGVRYEYFKINEESESRPVFRSGINYRIAEETYLRASYGQGYRFPTIAEKFIQTSVGVINIYPNEEIRSETSTNLEFGVKQGFKMGPVTGFLDLAVFRQHYDDFVEFTFGQWLDPTIDNFLGLGFRSINTGEAEVLGAEFTAVGKASLENSSLQFLFGYTYTLPRTLDPDYEYAESPVDTNNVFYRPDFALFTYNATSENPENNILKYRIQHLIRADVQWSSSNVDLGMSVRMNSQMENIDNIYGILDSDDIQPNLLSGINQWRDEHTSPDFVFDARASYHVNDHHKISLIVNNLTNLEYSIRPLTVEAPRTTVIQYIYTL